MDKTAMINQFFIKNQKSKLSAIRCLYLKHSEGAKRTGESDEAGASIWAIRGKSIDATVGQKPIYEQYIVLSLFPFDQSKAIHMPIDQVANHLVAECRPVVTVEAGHGGA